MIETKRQATGFGNTRLPILDSVSSCAIHSDDKTDNI